MCDKHGQEAFLLRKRQADDGRDLFMYDYSMGAYRLGALLRKR